MINLSFDELRLIAQIRNISDYENKYKEGFIRALSESKPETLKPQTPKPEIRKPETKPKQTQKPDTKPKPEPQIPKIRVKTNKTKLRKLRKDFDELRQVFFKKNR